MAVVRARSAPPYGMILLAFLWVISTVLAILFYLNASAAQDAANKAQTQYNAAVSSRDQAAVQQLLAEKTQGGPTSAVGIAMQEISGLKKVIGSDVPVPELVAPNGTVASALARTGIANTSLLDAVNSLSGQLAEEKKNVAAMQANLTSLQAQVDAN